MEGHSAGGTPSLLCSVLEDEFDTADQRGEEDQDPSEEDLFLLGLLLVIALEVVDIGLV